jgi:predicted metal-dependent phosphoesterase TrpH
LTYEAILRKAKQIGLNVIGIVDHNSLFKQMGNQNDITIFFGEEIKTIDGEIIGFEIKRDIEPNLDLIETCRQIKKQGGFVFIPHPFDYLRFKEHVGNKIYDIIKYADFIEVFNSRCIFNYFNKKAEEFAKKYKIPMVGGSDAHFEYEIGSCVNIIRSKNKKDDIIKAIKNGDIVIKGKLSGIKPHIETSQLRLIKNLGRVWRR